MAKVKAWLKKFMCWLTGGHTYKSGDFQQLHIPEMGVTCFRHQCVKCGEHQVYAVKDEVLYGKYPVRSRLEVHFDGE